MIRDVDGIDQTYNIERIKAGTRAMIDAAKEQGLNLLEISSAAQCIHEASDAMFNERLEEAKREAQTAALNPRR